MTISRRNGVRSLAPRDARAGLLVCVVDQDDLDRLPAVLHRDPVIDLGKRHRGDQFVDRELAGLIKLDELRNEDVRVAVTLDDGLYREREYQALDQRQGQRGVRVGRHAQHAQGPLIAEALDRLGDYPGVAGGVEGEVDAPGQQATD